MRLARYSGLPYRVSSDLGQLAVNRHFTSGMDWAIAGAATAVAARPPAPAVLINFRLDSFVMPVLLGGSANGGRAGCKILSLGGSHQAIFRPRFASAARRARHHRPFSRIAKLPLTSIGRPAWRSPARWFPRAAADSWQKRRPRH